MTGAMQVHSRSAPLRRRAALLALVLAAALLHLALLDGALRLWPEPATAPPPAARPSLSFRTLVAPAPAPGPTGPADGAPPAASTGVLPRVAALRSSPPMPQARPKPSRPRPALVEPLPASPPVLPARTEAALALAPVYPTAIATSATLRYRVRRDAQGGTAELEWQASGETYAAQLDIVLDGRVVARQASQGGFDIAGLAPRRFTDRRRRGGVQAANFERELGEVMFSGPTHRLGLVAGAQDRLSWLLQLGAVLQAEPQRSVPGGELVFTVFGARGDGRPWVFRFEAVEPVATDAGPVEAVKWVREPDAPYDTRVEIWLAPSMQHLPVRMRSGSMTGAGVLEMTLLAP